MPLDEGLLELSKRDLVRLVMKYQAMYEELADKVAKLEKLLLAYENPHTPPSLSRKRRKPREPTGRSPGAPKGHSGTTRPNPKPDKIITVSAPKECPACSSKLGKVLYYITRLIEEIPEPRPVHVTLYRLPFQHCRGCGKEVVASHPDCPDTGRFGYNTQAHITLLKYDGRLPHRKIAEALEREYGLTITPATVMDINRRVGEKAMPEYSRIIARIRESKFVHIDETGLRVAGERYWVWTFTTEHDTLFVIRHSRGKNVLLEILGKQYSGIIICDGHKAYPNFSTSIQRCWAHLLREAKHLSEHLPQAVPLYRKLRALYRRLVGRYRDSLSGQQRYYLWWRANRRMQQLLQRYRKVKSLGKLLGKIRNGLRHWFTFLLHPEIEPTNNRAERALREVVVQRKIFGCLRNGKGTGTMAVIMSLLATWKQRGLNPHTELLAALRS